MHWANAPAHALSLVVVQSALRTRLLFALYWAITCTRACTCTCTITITCACTYACRRSRGPITTTGKVDVEKIEKAATTPQSKPAEAGQDAPACCTIM